MKLKDIIIRKNINRSSVIGFIRPGYVKIPLSLIFVNLGISNGNETNFPSKILFYLSFNKSIILTKSELKLNMIMFYSY